MTIYDDQSETIVAHIAVRSTGKTLYSKTTSNTEGRR